jgi:hypothetical protein
MMVSTGSDLRQNESITTYEERRNLMNAQQEGPREVDRKAIEVQNADILPSDANQVIFQSCVRMHHTMPYSRPLLYLVLRDILFS